METVTRVSSSSNCSELKKKEWKESFYQIHGRMPKKDDLAFAPAEIRGTVCTPIIGTHSRTENISPAISAFNCDLTAFNPRVAPKFSKVVGVSRQKADLPKQDSHSNRIPVVLESCTTEINTLSNSVIALNNNDVDSLRSYFDSVASEIDSSLTCFLSAKITELPIRASTATSCDPLTHTLKTPFASSNYTLRTCTDDSLDYDRLRAPVLVRNDEEATYTVDMAELLPDDDRIAEEIIEHNVLCQAEMCATESSSVATNSGVTTKFKKPKKKSTGSRFVKLDLKHRRFSKAPKRMSGSQHKRMLWKMRNKTYKR